MIKNDPLKTAYAVARTLQSKGYEAGVIFSAEEVSIAIKINGRLLETKICEELANMGDEWLANKFEEYIKKIN